MITFKPQGRLGNVLLQNIGASIISKKFDLKVKNYYLEDVFENLGCRFHQGSKILNDKVNITDYELMSLLNEKKINTSIDYVGYFQVKEFVLEYKDEILSHFNLKYCEDFSNDVFIHVRLGDAAIFNPGYNYYYKCLSKINYDKIYLSTDSPNNELVKKLISDFNAVLYENSPIETLKFAKNFGNLILSKGTFSWWIGMLSVAKNVYYPTGDTPWCGDIFVFDYWEGIEI